MSNGAYMNLLPFLDEAVKRRSESRAGATIINRGGLVTTVKLANAEIYAEALEAITGRPCQALYVHMPIVGALLRVARQAGDT
jgi:hypothetical protein